MIPNTIARMFVETCDRYAGRTDKAVYARKVDGVWQTLTHDQLRTRVEALALGLLAYGIVPGERMGIVSENRIEWAVADFASACTGIIDVPVFPTLTAAQMAEVFSDCEASAIIVSNRLQLSKILSIRDAVPTLRLIIVMNDDVELAHGCVRFADVEQRGQSSVDAQTRAMQLRAMAERIAPDELLTLIYTSGTTGTPKGVMLTHGNITSNIAGALDAIPMSDSDVLLSYLPLCHSYERMAGYYLAFGVGASTWFAESIETVADNLAEVRPTVMTSVPRLFERIRNRVLSAAAKSPAPRRAIFQWAMRVGQQHRVKPTPLSRAQVRVADTLVYSKIRQRTGGRLRFFVSGGAALSVDVGSFFFMVGLPILEGYGLTETAPVLAVNRVGDETLGTVGPPLPNVELRIADDGEILARGPNVMKGYWKRPHETAEVIDPDGWFHTGDIGRFDDHGRLIITDRKKHLLVSSTGKNIAPQPIEQLLTQSPLIDQAMLIGNNREYCTALIVLDVEGVQGALRDQGVTVGDVYTSEVVHRLVWNDIARLQKDLSKYERVRRFTMIREPFTVENGLMTPTLKVRRKAVETRYSAEIEAMYSGPDSDIP
jgi:long-chain acyl-CoA synthetase